LESIADQSKRLIDLFGLTRSEYQDAYHDARRVVDEYMLVESN